MFHHGGESQAMQFCCWQCVIEMLPKLKTDYFISLPFLHFDEESTAGVRAQDFFKAISKFKSRG